MLDEDEEFLAKLRKTEARGRLALQLSFWGPFSIAILCALALTWAMGESAGEVKGMRECLDKLAPEVPK